MKITFVEPQKRNPHRFNIYLDGQFAFGADEDLVVERRLVVGKEISAEDMEKILFETEVGKLMERIYRLINIRQRSEKEIRNYLKNLSFKRKLKGKDELSLNIIEVIIELMKKKQMINDEQFARNWVEARSKKYGPKKVKLELLQKGISREIINGIMNNESQVMDEKQAAEKVLQKKLKVWKDLPDLEFKKKAYEYLMRRGFEYDMVKEIIDTFDKLSVPSV